MKPLIATLALLLPLAATAQDVWRCGPDGRSYSSTPCNEGRRLDALDSRPASDIAAAQQAAARQQRLADALTRERLAQESAQRGNGLGSIAQPAPAVKPVAAVASRHRTKKHRTAAEEAGIWRAVAPGSRQTKG